MIESPYTLALNTHTHTQMMETEMDEHSVLITPRSMTRQSYGYNNTELWLLSAPRY